VARINGPSTTHPEDSVGGSHGGTIEQREINGPLAVAGAEVVMRADVWAWQLSSPLGLAQREDARPAAAFKANISA